MGKEWTDEEVTAEIQKAVQIVKEDKILKAVRGFGAPKSDDPNNPNPPKPNGTPADGTKKKGGLRWGTPESETS